MILVAIQAAENQYQVIYGGFANWRIVESALYFESLFIVEASTHSDWKDKCVLRPVYAHFFILSNPKLASFDVIKRPSVNGKKTNFLRQSAGTPLCFAFRKGLIF